jgi:hypothetical protein
MDKVNLTEKFAHIDEVYKPKLVAEYNDNKVILTRAQGEFVWHKHDETDDLFLVVSGRLVIQLRDRDVELNAGELSVVPRGVEHCPRRPGGGDPGHRADGDDEHGRRAGERADSRARADLAVAVPTRVS